MPDKTKKHQGNVAGRFYVDKECVDCDLCRQTSKANFDRNPTGKYSYVAKQPENDLEIQACINAMNDCPVQAIGNDGDN